MVIISEINLGAHQAIYEGFKTRVDGTVQMLSHSIDGAGAE